MPDQVKSKYLTLKPHIFLSEGKGRRSWFHKFVDYERKFIKALRAWGSDNADPDGLMKNEDFEECDEAMEDVEVVRKQVEKEIGKVTKMIEKLEELKSDLQDEERAFDDTKLTIERYMPLESWEVNSDSWSQDYDSDSQGNGDNGGSENGDGDEEHDEEENGDEDYEDEEMDEEEE